MRAFRTRDLGHASPQQGLQITGRSDLVMKVDGELPWQCPPCSPVPFQVWSMQALGPALARVDRTQWSVVRQAWLWTCRLWSESWRRTLQFAQLPAACVQARQVCSSLPGSKADPNSLHRAVGAYAAHQGLTSSRARPAAHTRMVLLPTTSKPQAPPGPQAAQPLTHAWCSARCSAGSLPGAAPTAGQGSLDACRAAQQAVVSLSLGGQGPHGLAHHRGSAALSWRQAAARQAAGRGSSSAAAQRVHGGCPA